MPDEVREHRMEYWMFENSDYPSFVAKMPRYFGGTGHNILCYCDICGSIHARRFHAPTLNWYAIPTGCPSCCEKCNRYWTMLLPIEERNPQDLPLEVLILEFLCNPIKENQHDPITQSPTDGSVGLRQDVLNSDPR